MDPTSSVEMQREFLSFSYKQNNILSFHSAQSHLVNIPKGFACSNCTLRLLREAGEWASTYRFWSCSDVDIVKERFKDSCSGNGQYIASKCKCDKTYYGHRCQYKDECMTNQDCGVQGQCIELNGTILPKKQCYCNYGFYGNKCMKKSPEIFRKTDLDLSIYQMKQLSPDYKMYWRLLEEQKEIEVILKVNGTSWAGLGWRPNGLTAECKNFPHLKELGETSVSKSEPLTVAEPAPETLPEPEPKSEPSAEPEPKSEPSAEPEPKSEPSAEPEATNKSKRVAKNQESFKPEEYKTVSTSVTYHVSQASGRRRRREAEPSAGKFSLIYNSQ